MRREREEYSPPYLMWKKEYMALPRRMQKANFDQEDGAEASNDADSDLVGWM
jgi:hypothetical protein